MITFDIYRIYLHYIINYVLLINNIYFSITTIQTNQEDLMEMDVYLFDVFTEGKFESHRFSNI